MTDAQQRTDRRMAMLDRLAEMDFAAAEHAHAKLLAADDAKALAEAGRTYQRLARSVRQSLALAAKLDREQAQDAAAAAATSAAHTPKPIRDIYREVDDLQIDHRIEALQDAIGRVIEAATVDAPEQRERLYERFDRELDDWITEGFITVDRLEDQVLGICQALELPEDLVRSWRTLPKGDDTPDPATRDIAEPPAFVEPAPAAATDTG